MNQQVNFYQPRFRPQPVRWPAQHFLAALLIVGSGMAGWYGVERSSLGALHTQRAALEQELAAAEARVAALDARLATEDPALAERVRTLRGELQARRELLGYLQTVTERPGPEFSEYLEGLARRHRSGLWLTGIGINAGGARLRLKGSALNASQVPDFLSDLSAEAAYSGRTFDQLLVKRPADAAWKIDFELRTVREESGS